MIRYTVYYYVKHRNDEEECHHAGLWAKSKKHAVLIFHNYYDKVRDDKKRIIFDVRKDPWQW